MFGKFHCYGIDLGYTNSSIVGYNNSDAITYPTSIPNDRGMDYTPNVVTFNDKEVLVGQIAIEQKDSNKCNTFHHLHELIGRDFSSIKKLGRKLDFPVYANSKNSKVELHVCTKRYHGERENDPLVFDPEEIYAIILHNIQSMTNNLDIENTNNFVISVPPSFNSLQIRAIKDAAYIAGINVVDVISAPIATSIMHAYSTGYKKERRIVLIYDYGENTIDVSFVQIEGCKFTILETNTEYNIGYYDLVDYVCDHIMKNFFDKHKIDLRPPENPDEHDIYCLERNRLRQSCEECINSLSETNPLVKININFIKDTNGEYIDFTDDISNALLEQYYDQRKEIFNKPIKSFLQHHTEISNNDIENVILLGYPLKRSCFYKTIFDEINKEPSMPIVRYKQAASGASIYGAWKCGALMNVGDFKGFTIQDVTTMAIGLGSRGGNVDVMIQKNTPLPAEGTWTRIIGSRTSKTNFLVYEGNSKRMDECYKIGKFSVDCNSCEGHTEKIVFYMRIVVDKNKNISISAVQSDTEPTSTDDLKQLVVTNDRYHYTEVEITTLRNKCIDVMRKPDIKPEEIAYEEVIVLILQKFINSVSTKIKDKKKKEQYKCDLRNLKQKIYHEYKEKTLTKETFISIFKEQELKAKEYWPEYKRSQSIRNKLKEAFVDIPES